RGDPDPPGKGDLRPVRGSRRLSPLCPRGEPARRHLGWLDLRREEAPAPALAGRTEAPDRLSRQAGADPGGTSPTPSRGGSAVPRQRNPLRQLAAPTARDP